MVDDELNKLLEKSRRNAEKQKEAINKLKRRIFLLEDTILSYVHQLRNDYIPDYMVNDVIDTVRQEAPHILEDNALRAVRITREFDTSIFTSGLIEAIRDNRTYHIERQGNLGISVKIDLDFTAGTLADYAAGVKFAREHFSKVQGPEAASITWKLSIYKPAREGRRVLTGYGVGGRRENWSDRTKYHMALYWRTMNLRKMGSANKLAPWWKLVEYGNKNISMESDWGGTPYPTYEGQYFVNDSENEIIEHFNNLLSYAINEFQKELSSLINYNRRQLLLAKADLRKLLEETNQEEVEIVYKLVIDHLNTWYESDKLKTITEDMLDRVAEQVMAGKMPRIRLGKGAPRIRTTRILQNYKRELKEILGY